MVLTETSLSTKMILTEISLWLKMILTERVNNRIQFFFKYVFTHKTSLFFCRDTLSLVKNDIDRDISVAENDIDREGQQQIKNI